MKNILSILFCVLFIIPTNNKADEGMWLPMLIKRLNMETMQDMGLQLTADEIYSINQSSLKDAIVSFNGYCTGEMISANGLLLTNHHCGYDAIQNHSSVENDYLGNGFWAKSHEEEMPNEGVFVDFLISFFVTSPVPHAKSKTLSPFFILDKSKSFFVTAKGPISFFAHLL